MIPYVSKGHDIKKNEKYYICINTLYFKRINLIQRQGPITGHPDCSLVW